MMNKQVKSSAIELWLIELKDHGINGVFTILVPIYRPKN